MNKLIELLNEYERERVNHSMPDFIPYGEKSLNDLSVAQIISKKFGFIQRLAKHFNLNMIKIDARIVLSDFNATDRMLMALAISEDPIALLVDCLKQNGETSKVIEGIGERSKEIGDSMEYR